MTLTWANGRQLSTLTKRGSTYSYNYDIDGNRTKKVANGVTTEYYLNEGTIVAEKAGSNVIRYLFDENGDRFGLEYNGSKYVYLFNAQGDVVAIVNSSNQLVAKYAYDAWGKLLSITGSAASTVGAANPIRYRGYYYDTETGFYATGTRYYDPVVGRWINSDGVGLLSYGLENLTQYNMFTYCFNNPVMYYDPTGEFPILAGIIGLAVVTYVAIAARDGMNNKESNLNAQQSFSGGYIYDQNQVNQFKMGRAGAAWNGCGWIAAYNAMIMLGNPQQPADVISYFDNAWGNIALGAFGTNPLAMGRYFGLQGYTGKSSAIPGSMPSDIEAVAQNASACVLLYAHSQGAHYTALKWNGKSYDVYNDRSGFLSIKDYMSQVGGTFIKIWCID